MFLVSFISAVFHAIFGYLYLAHDSDYCGFETVFNVSRYWLAPDDGSILWLYLRIVGIWMLIMVMVVRSCHIHFLFLLHVFYMALSVTGSTASVTLATFHAMIVGAILAHIFNTRQLEKNNDDYVEDEDEDYIPPEEEEEDEEEEGDEEEETNDGDYVEQEKEKFE